MDLAREPHIVNNIHLLPHLLTVTQYESCMKTDHDDVIKWEHLRVTGHLCGEFTGPRWNPRTKASDVELWYFSLICVWINGWVNTREAGDWRRYRAHYDVIVMLWIRQNSTNKFEKNIDCSPARYRNGHYEDCFTDTL